jgi:cystathionine beta-lyase
MPKRNRLSRRLFLTNAGLTTVVGLVGPPATIAAPTAAPESLEGGTKFDFDEVFSRVGTDCVKWDEQMVKYGKDNIAVGMGIADMDFRAAPCITKALAERCRDENWGYLSLASDEKKYRTATTSFVQSIVSWNKRRYGLVIDPETVVISNGVHPGLVAALKTFSPPGSKVLLSTPIYNGFYTDLAYCNLLPEDSPMKLVNGQYSVDFEDLESRISHDTNVLILCNPQNPTGNCWSREDLMRIGEICLRRRVVVLADEIHCDFVMKGQKYTPFASLPDKDIVHNSLTFKAASKTFNLAAMKNAWFFSTNPEYLARVKANHRADTNTLGVAANQAALDEGESWFDALLPYIDANHDCVVGYLREKLPCVKYTKAQGTYLAWLDIREVMDRIGATAKAAAEASKSSAAKVTPEVLAEEWFIRHAKVQLNAGSKYGTGGSGHLRMNLATTRKNIEWALDSITNALKRV